MYQLLLTERCLYFTYIQKHEITCFYENGIKMFIVKIHLCLESICSMFNIEKRKHFTIILLFTLETVLYKLFFLYDGIKYG